jgi:hypothetical protein
MMSERSIVVAQATELAIAKLPRPRSLARSLSLVCVLYRVKSRAKDAVPPIDYRSSAEKPEGTLASPDVLQRASELGLRFAGVYEFLGLVSWIPREAWLTEDGEVRVSARRGKAGGFEGGMASYYLSTTFDDGKVLVTFSKASPLTSSERSVCMGGTGDLATDLGRHREAIARAMKESPSIRPITVTSVDDAVALSVYHDRFAISDAELGGLLNVRLYGWGGMAAIAAAIAWAVLRFV